MKLKWSEIGVHWYAFSGETRGFHISKGDGRGNYCLSIYIHRPTLQRLYGKCGFANVDDAKQGADLWIKENNFKVTPVVSSHG